MTKRFVSTCKHCGKRIVKVNYALGPTWVHQENGAAFSDGIHDYCRTTTAEPLEEPNAGDAHP